MRDHPKSEGSSLPSRDALVDAYWQLHRMHPQHLVRLESASPGQLPLPEELRHESRDKYRIVMTMILSPQKRDIQLAPCLGRLFKMHPGFDSLRNLEKSEITQLLGPIKDGGIGLGDPRGGNTARLWAVMTSYFGPWNKTITPENTQALVAIEGFGPKIVRLFEAYCWGNKDVFPLDQPAFRALLATDLYENGSNIDKVRSDVEAKLAGQRGVSLIDFHEMLRFDEQSRGKSKKEKKDIIIGWNAWRLLCSMEWEGITDNWRWIYEHLVRDEDVAKELWRFCRRITGS